MLQSYRCITNQFRAVLFLATALCAPILLGTGKVRGAVPLFVDNQQTTSLVEPAVPPTNAATEVTQDDLKKTDEKKPRRDDTVDIQHVLQRLNGDWNLVSGVNQGRKLSPSDVVGSHVIINDNTIVVLDGKEKELYKASFELDVTSDDKPHRINMSSDVPDAPKAIAFGILQFTKAGWKLAYGLPGSERPVQFASPTGSKVMLFEMAAAEKKDSPIPEDDNLPKK